MSNGWRIITCTDCGSTTHHFGVKSAANTDDSGSNQLSSSRTIYKQCAICRASTTPGNNNRLTQDRLLQAHGLPAIEESFPVAQTRDIEVVPDDQAVDLRKFFRNK